MPAGGDGDRDGGRERGASPAKLSSALSDALEALELDRALPGARIAEIWVEVVGPEAARHCRPIGLRAGVLHAEVDSSVWAQELHMRSGELLEALRSRLGDEAPTDLRVRVGYTPAP